MHRALLIIISLLFTSCAYSEKADIVIKQKYTGKKIDDFVIDNGTFLSSQKLDKGGEVLVWSSGHNSSITGINGNIITNHSECKLKLISDKNKYITDIKIIYDRSPSWTGSRCYNHFKTT